MNALQRLIREHVESTGETLADIARRGGMPRQTVSLLANREHMPQTPHAPTLRRLAVGLGVDLNTVRAAAAEAAGFEVVQLDDPDKLVIVAALEPLTPEARAALKARAEQWLAEAAADESKRKTRNNNARNRKRNTERRTGNDRRATPA